MSSSLAPLQGFKGRYGWRGVILFANQRTFRADAEVETDKGSVRFQALVWCPGEALYNQAAIVGIFVGLCS